MLATFEENIARPAARRSRGGGGKRVPANATRPPVGVEISCSTPGPASAPSPPPFPSGDHFTPESKVPPADRKDTGADDHSPKCVEAEGREWPAGMKTGGLITAPADELQDPPHRVEGLGAIESLPNR